MGRPTCPLHDAGNHGPFERRSLRQAARRGRLTTRPDLPETWSGPALLHHAEGHDLDFGSRVLQFFQVMEWRLGRGGSFLPPVPFPRTPELRPLSAPGLLD